MKTNLRNRSVSSLATLVLILGLCSGVRAEIQDIDLAESSAATAVAPSQNAVDGTRASMQSPTEIKTPKYRAYESGIVPQFGTYTYEVSWNGIPAAEATIELGNSETNYKVVATARTYSAIDLFYKLRYRAEGLLSPMTLNPLRTFIKEAQNSKGRTTEITFRDGEIESVRERDGKPTEVLRLATNNVTLDPFGAAFLARGLKWQVGDTKTFDTFNGKTRYLITLTATGMDEISFNGEKRRCFVIEPSVRKLNNEQQHKLRSAKIYLTDDENRDIIRIVSSVFVGSVTTALQSFEPRTTPAPIVMAQAQALKALNGRRF